MFTLGRRPSQSVQNRAERMPVRAYGVLHAFWPGVTSCHYGGVDATKTTFNGRAYGMDIRVEREDDGTLSVYEASPFSGSFRFVKRGPADEIIKHYDVSGSMKSFFKDRTS